MNSSPATGNGSSFVSKPGKPKLAALTLLALGVVYGDIGTSPLYAFKEAFSGSHGLPLNEANVLAVLSLMFWSLMLIVSLKYVTMMLRFDNRGEGGILALLALASRATRDRPRLAWTIATAGIFGASLFYGDALLTPAQPEVRYVTYRKKRYPAYFYRHLDYEIWGLTGRILKTFLDLVWQAI